MVNNLFDFIGKNLKATWINVVNPLCVQLKDGTIVNLVGDEKEESGMEDNTVTGIFIIINPKFTYAQTKQLSSNTKEFKVAVNFKIVFYSIDEINSKDPLYIENYLSSRLRLLPFSKYKGEERFPEIQILSSNVDASEVYKEASKKERSEGAKLVAVSVDAKLMFYSTNNCVENCDASIFSFCDPCVINNFTQEEIKCLTGLFGNFVEPISFTGDIDGVNKEFLLPRKPLFVFLQGYKYILNRPTTGYTLSGNDTIGWTVILTDPPQPGDVTADPIQPPDALEFYGNHKY